MSRQDDFAQQVTAALWERTSRGAGWVSLPSPDPIMDLPMIMTALKEVDRLDGVTFQLTPAPDGWWDILIVIQEAGYELRPGPGRLCPDDELCARPARCQMGAGCPWTQELSSKVSP